LSLRRVRTDQRNAGAHDRENRPPCAHWAEFPRPLRNVNLRIRNTAIMAVKSSGNPADSVNRMGSLFDIVRFATANPSCGAQDP
jgi:hypothetical protein